MVKALMAVRLARLLQRLWPSAFFHEPSCLFGLEVPPCIDLLLDPIPPLLVGHAGPEPSRAGDLRSQEPTCLRLNLIIAAGHHLTPPCSLDSVDL